MYVPSLDQSTYYIYGCSTFLLMSCIVCVHVCLCNFQMTMSLSEGLSGLSIVIRGQRFWWRRLISSVQWLATKMSSRNHQLANSVVCSTYQYIFSQMFLAWLVGLSPRQDQHNSAAQQYIQVEPVPHRYHDRHAVTNGKPSTHFYTASAWSQHIMRYAKLTESRDEALQPVCEMSCSIHTQCTSRVHWKLLNCIFTKVTHRQSPQGNLSSDVSFAKCEEYRCVQIV